MAERQPVMSGFVRIDATNKVLRIKVGGSDSDVTLTEGVYWMGVNGSAGTSPATDGTMVTDYASLLTALSSGTGWDWVVDHPTQDALASPSASGHVYVQTGDATDAIYWGHANTTVDPRWFGVASTNNAFATYSFTGTNYEDVSDFSSALTYISDPLGAGGTKLEVDTEQETVLEVATQTGNGRVYSAYFASLSERLLRWRIYGLDRVLDNQRTTMRLFLHYQRQWRSLGFILFTDLSLSYAAIRVPEDTQEARRFGFDRYVFSPSESLDWAPTDTFQGYANITTREMRVTRYTLG